MHQLSRELEEATTFSLCSSPLNYDVLSLVSWKRPGAQDVSSLGPAEVSKWNRSETIVSMSKTILLGVCQAGGELGLERELSWSAGAFYLCISDGIIRGGLRKIADRLGA